MIKRTGNRQEKIPEDFSEAGFSLLEVTITLLILGIMGSMILPGLMAQQQSQKNHITREHQERILHALAVYVQLYGRLPCPGDPEQKGDKKGVARARCADVLAKGFVPFRTLGLPETYAKDGARQFFTYAVHPGLTSPKLTQFCSQTITKELIVKEEGIPVQGQSEQDQVAVVLVSHGPSVGEKTSPCQQENVNNDLIFCAKPPKEQVGIFKDWVRWETRLNFGTYYAKINCLESKR